MVNDCVKASGTMEDPRGDGPDSGCNQTIQNYTLGAVAVEVSIAASMDTSAHASTTTIFSCDHRPRKCGAAGLKRCPETELVAYVNTTRRMLASLASRLE